MYSSVWDANLVAIHWKACVPCGSGLEVGNVMGNGY